jgi:hypothetical protein
MFGSKKPKGLNRIGKNQVVSPEGGMCIKIYFIFFIVKLIKTKLRIIPPPSSHHYIQPQMALVINI